MPIRDLFARSAQTVARWTGTPTATIAAVAVIMLWAVSGPYFHYSDTWQLIINTGTSAVTFLMVFLIQSTQNRDTAAIQMKLDELIRVTASARNRLMELEDLPEQEVERLKKDFRRAAAAGGTGQATVAANRSDAECNC